MKCINMRLKYRSKPNEYLVFPDDVGLYVRTNNTRRCYVLPCCVFRAVRVTVPYVGLVNDLCL